MKTTQSVFLAVAAITVAAFFVGAKNGGSDRPASVEASRWHRISDTAGIALTAELGASRQPSGNFYLRTEKGWRAVSILNPVAAQPLSESAAARR